MDVKQILLDAAQLVENRTHEFMCNAIIKSVYFGYIPEEVIFVGFTRENYNKFIKEKFPNLEPYLMPHTCLKYSSPWMDLTNPEVYEEIIESKVEFLKYLANEGKTAKET